jgi:endonuclease/exonuclease/phosphatase family metal-dependent hydrolase
MVYGISLIGLLILAFPRLISKFRFVISSPRIQKNLVIGFIICILGSSAVLIYGNLKPHISPGPISQTSGITDLKIISYNIRYGTANEKNPLNNWEIRKGNFTQYLDSFNADIFCVQEALFDQLDYLQTNLSNRTYFYTGFGRNDGYQEGEYEAIFFDSNKYQFIDGDTFWLSDTPLYPSRTWGNSNYRVCTWARFQVITTGIQFCVFSTHYDFSDFFHEQASKLIQNKIVEYTANLPVLLMGDFNMHTTNSGFQYLEHYGEKPLLDSFRLANGGTAPYWASSNDGFKPTNTQDRIDFIFISSDISVLDCQIPHDSYGQNQTYSDHYPVILNCRF